MPPGLLTSRPEANLFSRGWGHVIQAANVTSAHQILFSPMSRNIRAANWQLNPAALNYETDLSAKIASARLFDNNSASTQHCSRQVAQAGFYRSIGTSLFTSSIAPDQREKKNQLIFTLPVTSSRLPHTRNRIYNIRYLRVDVGNRMFICVFTCGTCLGGVGIWVGRSRC